jgi:ABC-type antimicrobial peptide transport system permease subunit
MVVRQGASLAAIGILFGLGGAFALTRLLKTMLFGIGVTDALTFAAAPLGMMLVVLLATFVPALRATRIDPMLAIALPQSMEDVVAQALGQARLVMLLLGIFAGVALLLATVGIYGAVAYTVEQRTGEIGVRMALGAQTADVLRLVVRQGMTPVILGLVLGLTASLALGRLLTTQLYEVSANNPALLAGTSVTLAVVALLACLIPARRASLVNPIEALRTE